MVDTIFKGNLIAHSLYARKIAAPLAVNYSNLNFFVVEVMQEYVLVSVWSAQNSLNNNMMFIFRGLTKYLEQ